MDQLNQNEGQLSGQMESIVIMMNRGSLQSHVTSIKQITAVLIYVVDVI